MFHQEASVETIKMKSGRFLKVLAILIYIDFKSLMVTKLIDIGYRI